MEVYVLNKNFELTAVVDEYESLIWTDRYDEYGDFELYLAMDKSLLKTFKKNYYLQIKKSSHTMIIEELKITTSAEEGNHLIVTGRSLESILDRRIIWGQQNYTGNLQTAIEKMLTTNIISPSVANRTIDNFVFSTSSDSTVTALTIDNQYTGDTIYDVIHDLCETNNIGFKITLTQAGKFSFKLYAGKDRSYDQTANPYVVFSPNFDNIISSSYYSSNQEYKNITYIHGEGEGASRKHTTTGTGKGLNRRELYTDARDISSDTDDGTLTDSEYTKLLKARGKEKLAECQVTSAFEGEVDTEHVFVYGEDFDIGDVVQLEDGYGNEAAAFISEIVISISSSAVTTYPTFEVKSEEDDD